MFDRIELGIEFFEGLTAIDTAIVQRAAAEKCRDCGGRLHRGDYAASQGKGLWGRGPMRSAVDVFWAVLLALAIVSLLLLGTSGPKFIYVDF